MVMIKLYQGID